MNSSYVFEVYSKYCLPRFGEALPVETRRPRGRRRAHRDCRVSVRLDGRGRWFLLLITAAPPARPPPPPPPSLPSFEGAAYFIGNRRSHFVGVILKSRVRDRRTDGRATCLGIPHMMSAHWCGKMHPSLLWPPPSSESAVPASDLHFPPVFLC